MLTVDLMSNRCDECCEAISMDRESHDELQNKLVSETE